MLVESSIKFVLQSNKGDSSNVFYNPRMILNRDISILVAQSFRSDFKRKLRIADPMTGSGIRGLRYASEVAETEQILLNDIEPNAAAVAYYNSVVNNLASKVDVQCMDANVFLNLHSVPGKRLHLIDLDPYGSPVPYMDSALRALINGGLLAMTATDMAVLCGAKPRTCYRRYGGRPLRSEYSREVALRLLLGSLIVTAARHNMAVDVKLSHSTDHYVRTYVRVSRSAKGADKNLVEMGHISHCFNCLARTTFAGPIKYSKCTRCDRPTTLAGPLFLGRLSDEDFCKRLIAFDIGREKNNRLSRLLLLELEEADSPPTFYTVDAICDRLGLATPSPSVIIEGLKSQGHIATRTHFDGRAFKTNASVDSIEALIRKAS
jgi:tRNA (guanine26-N2/guanine27-N2)-dimethyltransferase